MAEVQPEPQDSLEFTSYREYTALNASSRSLNRTKYICRQCWLGPCELRIGHIPELCDPMKELRCPIRSHEPDYTRWKKDSDVK